MNNIIKELKKYSIKPTRYTIKNNVYIVDTDEKKYVLKKTDNSRNENNISIYSYLSSRSFDYYPKLISVDDGYEIYEYIEDINTPEEQKALDIINMMSLLHNKTTYYKELPLDAFKEKYENIKNEINELKDYYTNQISIIESKKYMSPSQYHLARNISIIFKSLGFCEYYLEKWYTLISNKNRIRQTIVHNNLDTSHILENKTPYLISWRKSKTDIPIYDFYNFYKKHYLDFDFEDLYNIYNAKYPLLLEERMLLFILLAIPPKIEFNKDELDNCKEINNSLEYIYKTEKLIKPDTLNETTKK